MSESTSTSDHPTNDLSTSDETSPLEGLAQATGIESMPVVFATDALEAKYRGMLAREKKYLKAIADLEQGRSRQVKAAKQLQRRITELEEQLKAVRRSWRFRLGSAIVAPLSVLRQQWRKVRGTASASAASTHKQAPAAKRSPPSFEELKSAFEANATADNSFAFASAAFYQKGHIVEAYRAIVPHLKVAAAGRQRQLAGLLGGLNRLMEQGPALPPRQQNSNLLVDDKRVLYCVHSAMPYLTNGYSTRTHGVATGARSAGADLVVAARAGFPWDTKGAAGVHAASERTEQVCDAAPYVFTPGPNLELLPLDQYIACAADAFAREAVRQRASLIHAASNHITGLAALLAARRLGLPFVYEVRGLWEVTQAADRPGWTETDRFQLAVRLETFVAQEADRVLAITAELKQELIARGVAAERIALLPNCVDIEQFAPIERDEALMAKLGLNPAHPTIGFAGSVVPYEGLELLVAALGRLAAEQVGFNLLIVGDGSALAALKKAVETAGLSSQTRFTGRVPREEIRDLISCMDIMPCPRTASDVTEMVSPLKPLEAMSMGKAVLLSDVSPHLEFAGPTQDRARLFRKNDVDDLAAALRSLIGDEAARKELGRNARRWVAQNRTWAQAGAVLMGAYATARSQATQLQRADADAVPPRRLRDVNIALIADRFSTDSLAPEVRLHRPAPQDWRELFAATRMEALLVESAWEGNDGAWHRGVGHYSDEQIAPLRELVEHCRAAGIPTLFWNKEDPVHFARFEQSAAMFDHVFTTDADCIPRYLSTLGTAARTASSLPFFAQPKLHNPIPSTRPWSHDICYAGSYYGQRYAERSHRLDELLRPAAGLSLTIYDRQHFKADSPYRFPEELSPFVKGGLDYADMVQAYKSHAVHINVNSVEDSPTMFSRRVMEIAASGTALLSSRGRGVRETMAGTVVTIDDADQAAQWLRLWLSDEAARHAAILPPMREVFRAHTAAHRLVQMLRTAGLSVLAPQAPRYALVCPVWSDAIAQAVERQSIRPAVVLAASRQTSDTAGQLLVMLDDTLDWMACVRQHDCEWVGLWEGSPLQDCHYEDLLQSTLWSSADAVGSFYVDPAGRDVAGPLPPVLMDQPVAVAGGLVSLASLRHAAIADQPATAALDKLQPTGTLLQRFRSFVPSAIGSAISARQTILVAGHDLKFLRTVMRHWQDQGHDVLVDEWTGHNKHDEARSLELLERADVVFCEWCLGNAVWYSQNKRPHQRLVVRFHSQELRSPLTQGVQANAVDTFIFVGGHILDAAVRRFGLAPSRCVVVPNVVTDDFLIDRAQAPVLRTVGFVGMTPQMKRLDRAIDLIERLVEADKDFRLIVKGKRPEEYPWMRSRPEEMRYYQEQYQRIADDPRLSAAVDFEGHGDDMPAFYRRMGFVVSLSDYESFHLTLADGAAAGAIPTTLDWLGADRIYPAAWLAGDVDGMAARILAVAADPSAAARERVANRHFVKDHFGAMVVLRQIDAVCQLAAQQ